MTPWGTVLTGEENFDQYFEASGHTDARHADSYARYGITGNPTAAGRPPTLASTCRRSPTSRSGSAGWWSSTRSVRLPARKATMLGQFKHERDIAVDRTGRVAAYMGDDERGDYIYKFVSRDRMSRRDSAKARRHNPEPARARHLYVARFTGDGAADSTAAPAGGSAHQRHRIVVDDMSVADVLIDTDSPPTRPRRPEWTGPRTSSQTRSPARCTAPSPTTSSGAPPLTDEANPLATSMVRTSPDASLTPASGNRNGYVLELTEPSRRAQLPMEAAPRLWRPDAPETYFAGYPKDRVSPISCPDNVAFDPEGNLWISTDGNALGSNDGLFRVPFEAPSVGT